MRFLVTADLHYNHPRSRKGAEELIAQMNSAGGDGVLLVGDTAVGAGDELERCLALFHINGPKLFVAGNHELWARSGDTYALFSEELPRRVRAAGWQWLETEPFVTRSSAIVGSIGWYDYSFAPADLGIPRRFYEHKVSPGAAGQFEEFAHLLADRSDISPEGMETVARWNDGRFIRLGRSDEAFLQEIVERLERQLASLGEDKGRRTEDWGLRTGSKTSPSPQSPVLSTPLLAPSPPPQVTLSPGHLVTGSSSPRRIVAAIHHLPFRELLPPPHSRQWDFAKAYLGSARIGELLLRYPAVDTVYCGHSHLAGEARIGPIHAINIGGGYRSKAYHVLDLGE